MNRCGSLDGNEFKRNFGQLPKRRFERKKKKKPIKNVIHILVCTTRGNRATRRSNESLIKV